MRQPGGITAQRVGQGPEVAEPPERQVGPGPATAPVREPALDEPGDGDDVPLQALGRVHGEYLHRIDADLGHGSVQATFATVRRRQPAEEGPEPGPFPAVGERHGDLDEGVEVGAGHRGPHSRPRGHLDVEQQRTLHLEHELRQRERRPAAQRPQHLAEPTQPRPGGAGQLLTGGTAPVRWRQLVEGLHEGGLVHYVVAQLPRTGRSPAGRGRLGRGHARAVADPPVRAQLHGPGPEGLEVARAEPQRRTGEQPHEGVAAGGIVHDLQGRPQIGDLRHGQQPAEPHHLDGQPPGPQRRLHEGELRTCPAEHGRGGPRWAGARSAPGGRAGARARDGFGDPPFPGDDLGDRRGLLVHPGQPGQLDPSRPGAGPGPQRRHRYRLPARPGRGNP